MPKLSRYATAGLVSATAVFCLLTAANAQRTVTIAPNGQQPPVQTPNMNAASAAAQSRSSVTVIPEDLSHLVLSPGSLITVHVFEEPDLDGSYRLDNDGRINMPLVGPIIIGTVTLREAESEIAAQLVASEILKTAHVVANISEYGADAIVVSGEVTTPGRFSVLGQHRLADVLAMAGGETVSAGDDIVIHRANKPEGQAEMIHYVPDSADPAAMNVEVHPGDTVVVKRAGIIYVIGAVIRPGGYVMQDHGKLDVPQAIALAVGTAPEAALSSITVLRKQPDGTVVEVPSHFTDFRKGKAPALQLQADDVVFVPSSKWKEGFLTAKQAVGAVASATIYVTH